MTSNYPPGPPYWKQACNQLTGTIPSNLGGLNQWFTFDVSKNLFEASMPNKLCDTPVVTGWGDLCEVD
jgi:hypothetical protein